MAKTKRSYEIEISETRCRSCAVCWEVCAPKVLTWKPPLNKAIIKDLDACTGCRLCEWLCPDWAIVVRPAVKPTVPNRSEALA